jgi:hypothetical protein
MNTEQKGISKAFELVKLVWDNEKTGSYTRVNSLMQNALKLAINAQFKFEENDFENLYKRYGGQYWFGANANGKGGGEIFYSLACEVGNTSAAQSYEAFYSFKPFISKKGKRLSKGSELKGNGKCYRVTGFDFEAKKIHFVSYDISNWQDTGKRNLHSFDNKEWNGFRKQLEDF